MKRALLLLATAGWVATGCQSTNDSGTNPSTQNQPYAPNSVTPPMTAPPPPNTMNNPNPSTGTTPAPPP
jgi:hypothetical protein